MNLNLHIVNRLSYGLRPGEWESLQIQKLDSYIQGQLHPESLADPPALQRQLQQFQTLNLSPMQLQQNYAPSGGKNLSPEEKKQQQARSRQPLKEARQARLLRAVYSSHQLQEVMVDFWFNHFNVFAERGLTRFWVGAYEEQALRPHALGQFQDLLKAVARHPAMLFYLDNWLNTDPSSPGAKGKFKGRNENYARELLELHTLGVEAGYTQNDVVTLARILTGWGIARPNQARDNSGFSFDPSRHDYSNKVFLEIPIAGEGIPEVEKALDILANHPATARHLSYKLAQYFVTDEPPTSLVNRLAERFLNTKGNIREVLTTLFQSSEFRDPRYYGSKFRTPYQYVVALLRATGVKSFDHSAVIGMLRQQEMLLYGCRTPDGYKNTQQAWLSSQAMLQRVSIATAFPRKFFQDNQSLDLNALKQSIGTLSQPTQTVVNASPPPLQATLLLGSPEMMRR